MMLQEKDEGLVYVKRKNMFKKINVYLIKLSKERMKQNKV